MKKINPIFVLALMTAVDMIGFGIIFPLLPSMQIKFGMDARQLGYLASIFSVSGLVGTIFFGYLSDKVGRKILLYVPFCLLSISYLFTAYATTYINLLVLRALSGFLSGNLSVAFAAASDVSTPENKFKNMGMLGASFGLGFMFGPAIGGFLAGNSNDIALVNLQMPFIFAFGITLIASLIALFFFKESLSKKDRLLDKKSNVIVSLIELLKNKKILFFTYLSILLSLILSGVEVYLGPWLKNSFNFTSQDIGIYWGIFAFLIVVSQLTLTRLFSAKTAIMVGFFVFSSSQFMLLITNNFYLLGISTILMTLSMGIIFPSINVSISSEGSKNQQGLIFGINQSVGNIGRILGPYILGILYSYNPDYAWIFIGVISIITGFFTLKFLQH